MPIISYDSDVGLGLGAKCFFLNQLGISESFDIVVFGSTLGERWVRFVFSYPDYELRQGKVYPLSIDLIADYDVYMKNNFFGIGPLSRYSSMEIYRREPLDLSLVFGKGISSELVVQGGIRYGNIRNRNFDQSGYLISLPPDLNQSTTYFTSLFANIRNDTRNSFIDPSQGYVFQFDAEYSPDISLSNVSFGKLGLQIMGFYELFEPKYVLAGRFWLQSLMGSNLPVQVLLSLGGNRTLRGYSQDRFLGTTSILSNLEFRFPIFWRFSGIVGLDAGSVAIKGYGLDNNIVLNSVAGLRFAFDTFIVRLDVGFSQENTGFYLNFGHVF
jgi:outer membrane protein assembly factor BamA